MWGDAEVARPRANGDRLGQAFGLVRVEDGTDVAQCQTGIARLELVERRERETGVLDRADARGEQEQRPGSRELSRGARGLVLVLEKRALRNDCQPGDQAGK